jgi:hypothetical protein
MFEGSARARLGRAMNTRSTPSSEHLNLSVGEEVDFFRAPSTKDISGWFGPAEVIDVSRAGRGIISVKHQSRIMEVQTQNIRRHLHFWTFFNDRCVTLRGAQQCLADHSTGFGEPHPEVADTHRHRPHLW